MPTMKKKFNFFESEEGVAVKQTLRLMTEDTRYNTDSSYSADSGSYPNNLIPFVDKHMNYLRSHPSTDPQHYLSNLRLITRLR